MNTHDENSNWTDEALIRHVLFFGWRCSIMHRAINCDCRCKRRWIDSNYSYSMHCEHWMDEYLQSYNWLNYNNLCSISFKSRLTQKTKLRIQNSFLVCGKITLNSHACFQINWKRNVSILHVTAFFPTLFDNCLKNVALNIMRNSLKRWNSKRA